MRNSGPKYKTGDKVLLPAHIVSAEIIRGKTYYKIREYKDILVEEKTIIDTDDLKAKAIFTVSDRSELDSLRKDVELLQDLLAEARSIARELADEEININATVTVQ